MSNTLCISSIVPLSLRTVAHKKQRFYIHSTIPVCWRAINHSCLPTHSHVKLSLLRPCDAACALEASAGTTGGVLVTTPEFPLLFSCA